MICDKCALAADVDVQMLHKECEAPETCPCQHHERLNINE